MQAIDQSRIRKTPFGDTPAPSEVRINREPLHRSNIAEGGSAYEIFSLMPALDGLSGAAAKATQRPIELRP